MLYDERRVHPLDPAHRSPHQLSLRSPDATTGMERETGTPIPARERGYEERGGGLRSHSGQGGRTHDQLYNEARERGIHGRSKINKREAGVRALAQALDRAQAMLMWSRTDEPWVEMHTWTRSHDRFANQSPYLPGSEGSGVTRPTSGCSISGHDHEPRRSSVSSPVRGSQIPSSGITKHRASGGVIAVGTGIPRLEVVT